MTPSQKTRLRELAQKATPISGVPSPVMPFGDPNGWYPGEIVNHTAAPRNSRADADFYSAANPAAVLSLLDELERKTRALEVIAGPYWVEGECTYVEHEKQSIEEVARLALADPSGGGEKE